MYSAASRSHDSIRLNSSRIVRLQDIPVTETRTIKTLILGNNLLRSLNGISSWRNLESLAVSNNDLRYYDSISHIRLLPKLKKASFEENPVSLLPYYRSFVISLCPNLETLDSVRISSSERDLAVVEAKELHSIINQLRISEIKLIVLTHAQLLRKCMTKIKFIRRSRLSDSQDIFSDVVDVTLFVRVLLRGGVFRTLLLINSIDHTVDNKIQDTLQVIRSRTLQATAKSLRPHLLHDATSRKAFFSSIISQCMQSQQSELLALLTLFCSPNSSSVSRLPKPSSAAIESLSLLHFQLDDNDYAQEIREEINETTECHLTKDCGDLNVRCRGNSKAHNPRNNVSLLSRNLPPQQGDPEDRDIDSKTIEYSHSNGSQLDSKTNRATIECIDNTEDITLKWASLKEFLVHLREEKEQSKANRVNSEEFWYGKDGQPIWNKVDDLPSPSFYWPDSIFRKYCDAQSQKGFSSEQLLQPLIQDISSSWIEIKKFQDIPKDDSVLTMSRLKSTVQDLSRDVKESQRGELLQFQSLRHWQSVSQLYFQQIKDMNDIARNHCQGIAREVYAKNKEFEEWFSFLQDKDEFVKVYETRLQHKKDMDHEISDLQQSVASVLQCIKEEEDRKMQLNLSSREVSLAIKGFVEQTQKSSAVEQIFRRGRSLAMFCSIGIKIRFSSVIRNCFVAWRRYSRHLVRISKFTMRMEAKHTVALVRHFFRASKLQAQSSNYLQSRLLAWKKYQLRKALRIWNSRLRRKLKFSSDKKSFQQFSIFLKDRRLRFFLDKWVKKYKENRLVSVSIDVVRALFRLRVTFLSWKSIQQCRIGMARLQKILDRGSLRILLNKWRIIHENQNRRVRQFLNHFSTNELSVVNNNTHRFTRRNHYFEAWKELWMLQLWHRSNCLKRSWKRIMKIIRHRQQRRLNHLPDRLISFLRKKRGILALSYFRTHRCLGQKSNHIRRRMQLKSLISSMMCWKKAVLDRVEQREKDACAMINYMTHLKERVFLSWWLLLAKKPPKHPTLSHNESPIPHLLEDSMVSSSESKVEMEDEFFEVNDLSKKLLISKFSRPNVIYHAKRLLHRWIHWKNDRQKCRRQISCVRNHYFGRNYVGISHLGTHQKRSFLSRCFRLWFGLYLKQSRKRLVSMREKISMNVTSQSIMSVSKKLDDSKKNCQCVQDNIASNIRALESKKEDLSTAELAKQELIYSNRFLTESLSLLEEEKQSLQDTIDAISAWQRRQTMIHRKWTSLEDMGNSVINECSDMWKNDDCIQDSTAFSVFLSHLETLEPTSIRGLKELKSSLHQRMKLKKELETMRNEYQSLSAQYDRNNRQNSLQISQALMELRSGFENLVNWSKVRAKKEIEIKDHEIRLRKDMVSYRKKLESWSLAGGLVKRIQDEENRLRALCEERRIVRERCNTLLNQVYSDEASKFDQKLESFVGSSSGVSPPPPVFGEVLNSWDALVESVSTIEPSIQATTLFLQPLDNHQVSSLKSTAISDAATRPNIPVSLQTMSREVNQQIQETERMALEIPCLPKPLAISLEDEEFRMHDEMLQQKERDLEMKLQAQLLSFHYTLE